MSLDLRIWPDMEQRSEAWFRARAGRPTASQFGRILTPTGEESSQWESYALELIAESRHPEEVQTSFYGNHHTERGETLEPEALDTFARMMPSLEIVPAGFVTRADEIVGCSPDALAKMGGEWSCGVEVKCPLAKNHLATIHGGEVPQKYLPQIHGGMAVTGLNFWYFVSYHEGEPIFIRRVSRDAYTEKLSAALDRFVVYYSETRKKLARDFAVITPTAEGGLM